MELKEFEIWCEGYSATGEHSPAHYYGKSWGKDFDEACINFRYPEDIKREWALPGEDPIIIKKGSDLNLDKNSDGTYRRGSERGGYGGNYSIWACQLFDNETDARKSFG